MRKILISIGFFLSLLADDTTLLDGIYFQADHIHTLNVSETKTIKLGGHTKEGVNVNSLTGYDISVESSNATIMTASYNNATSQITLTAGKTTGRVNIDFKEGGIIKTKHIITVIDSNSTHVALKSTQEIPAGLTYFDFSVPSTPSYLSFTTTGSTDYVIYRYKTDKYINSGYLPSSTNGTHIGAGNYTIIVYNNSNSNQTITTNIVPTSTIGTINLSIGNYTFTQSGLYNVINTGGNHWQTKFESGSDSGNMYYSQYNSLLEGKATNRYLGTSYPNDEIYFNGDNSGYWYVNLNTLASATVSFNTSSDGGTGNDFFSWIYTKKGNFTTSNLSDKTIYLANRADDMLGRISFDANGNFTLTTLCNSTSSPENGAYTIDNGVLLLNSSSNSFNVAMLDSSLDVGNYVAMGSYNATTQTISGWRNFVITAYGDTNTIITQDNDINICNATYNNGSYSMFHGMNEITSQAVSNFSNSTEYNTITAQNPVGMDIYSLVSTTINGNIFRTIFHNSTTVEMLQGASIDEMVSLGNQTISIVENVIDYGSMKQKISNESVTLSVYHPNISFSANAKGYWLYGYQSGKNMPYAKYLVYNKQAMLDIEAYYNGNNTAGDNPIQASNSTNSSDGGAETDTFILSGATTDYTFSANTTATTHDAIISSPLSEPVYELSYTNATNYKLTRYEFIGTTKLVQTKLNVVDGAITFTYADAPLSVSGNVYIASNMTMTKNSITDQYVMEIKFTPVTISELNTLFGNNTTFPTGSNLWKIYAKSVAQSTSTTEYSQSYLLNKTALDYLLATKLGATTMANRTINIPAGMSYIALGSTQTLNETQLQNYFGDKTIYTYANGAWRYWNNQSGFGYKGLSKVTEISATDGLLIESSTNSTITIPFDISKAFKKKTKSITKKGWHLVSTDSIMSPDELKASFATNGRTLKYIYSERNNEAYLKDTSTTHEGIKTLEYVMPTESFWVYLE